MWHSMLEIETWRRILVITNTYFPGRRICITPFKAVAICFTKDTRDFSMLSRYIVVKIKLVFQHFVVVGSCCVGTASWSPSARPCHVICGPRWKPNRDVSEFARLATSCSVCRQVSSIRMAGKREGGGGGGSNSSSSSILFTLCIPFYISAALVSRKFTVGKLA
jgi:hypothetical protein